MAQSSSFRTAKSFLADTPAENDVLDYAAYRDALVSIIEGLDEKSPLTIAVFGDWGSGKTTLLKMVRDEVGRRNVQSIWVNVWQFGNEEDVWTAFLQSIFLKVKGEMPWFKRFLFNVGLLKRQINWAEIYKKIPEAIIRILVVVMPLSLSLSIAAGDQSSQSKITAGVGTLLGVVLGWFLLLQPYVRAVRDRVKVDLKNLIKSSHLRERVSLLDQFRRYFEEMIASLVGPDGRLVIFVDDLDRCQPDRIVQVLDAIKLFLEIPSCVYLIGLDRDIVEQAIQVKFKDYQRPEREAREYLEKIIGLPFDLPPLSGHQMEILVKSLETELPDLERAAQVFALGQEPNPRKVKRTINMFLLLWALAQGRAELRGMIKPTRLAKLVVIQHSYRDFYVVLTASPSGIGELEAFLRHPNNDDIASLPDYLKPFASDSSLGRLLTLHTTDESEDANFTLLQDGQYKPLSDDEIRAYIRLTRSVTRDQPAVVKSFISRQNEVDAFLKILSGAAEQRILVVTGPGGIGKTSLLQKFRDICADQQVPVIRLDPRYEGSSANSLLKQIVTGIEREIPESIKPKDRGLVSDTARLIRKLLDITTKTKMVLMLDDFELISPQQRDWFIKDFLKWIIDEKVINLIFVISGREVSFEKEPTHLVYRITLDPFSKQDTEEYLKQLGLPTSDEIVDFVQGVSKGNPVMISTMADSVRKFESNFESS